MGPDRFQKTYLYCISIFIYIFNTSCLSSCTYALYTLSNAISASIFNTYKRAAHLITRRSRVGYMTFFYVVFTYSYSQKETPRTRPLGKSSTFILLKKKTSTTPEGDFVSWTTAKNAIKKLLLTKSIESILWYCYLYI